MNKSRPIIRRIRTFGADVWRYIQGLNGVVLGFVIVWVLISSFGKFYPK